MSLPVAANVFYFVLVDGNIVESLSWWRLWAV